MTSPSVPLHSAQGKTVVITGATGGLGKKTAEAFAARGHSLVLLDRNQDRLDALTKDLNLPAERLLGSMVDLRDGEAVRATAEAAAAKFGGVQALIHLVGGWVGGKTLMEGDAKDRWENIIEWREDADPKKCGTNAGYPCNPTAGGRRLVI